MDELSKGYKVVILSLKGASSRYTSDLIGLEGLVQESCDTPNGKRIGITIPGHTNSMSQNNYFWFPYENLKVKEGNIEMEKNMKAYVICEINDAEDCSVGASYEDLKPGDIVVCDYKRYKGKLSVRRVVSLAHDTEDDLREITPACIILGVADISTYINETAKKERRAELKRRMIEQAKKYQEEVYWRLISETDETMKAMYDEFKKLED